MICTLCKKVAVHPPVVCEKCGKLVCKGCRNESFVIGEAVSITNTKDLARKAKKSVTCKPCTVETTPIMSMRKKHWTELLKCGFCHFPSVVPYVAEPGPCVVVGEFGSCQICRATFCRDHGMVGLVNCAGSGQAEPCLRRMCEKCASKIGVATHVCKDCFFRIAERELSR